MKNQLILPSALSLLLLGLITAPQPGLAMEDMAPAAQPSSEFRRIEQPLPIKLAVTVGGLGLMGLELWWFLLSSAPTRKAQVVGGLQEVTITVDGGYTPSQIALEAGKPVRLSFVRSDPSSCLETLIFPDFHRSIELPLNTPTAIELPPPQPGKYAFHCGMNMYRGTLTVQ